MARRHVSAAAAKQGLKRKPLTVKVLRGLHQIVHSAGGPQQVRKKSDQSSALDWLHREIEVSGVIDQLFPLKNGNA